MPLLIQQLLLEAASRAPSAIALIDPKSSWTYETLAREALRVATALEQLGVRPGDLVGLCMEKSNVAVASLYGIMLRGAAYVPIDPSMPLARATRIAEHTDLRVVVTTANLAQWITLATPHARGIVVAGGLGQHESPAGVAVVELTNVEPREASARTVTDGYLAYVLHTSGSTGQPKGVAISHRNCLAFVEPATRRFGVSLHDRFACQAPLHFDLSVFDLFCAAMVGGSAVLFPDYYSAFPKKMAKAIGEHQITIWNSVVSAISLLVEAGRLADHPRESLRAVIFSGERMPIPLLRKLFEVVPRAKLFNVYGQTEANSSLVYEVPSPPDTDSAALPLGDALDGFEVFLQGDNGDALDGAATGELSVRAATVASGAYYRDVERSRDKFVRDPVFPDSGMMVYRTGDLARRDEDGRLFLVGRRDDMIKTRGYRVEIGEVERAFERVPGVVELAVVALPDPHIGHRLHAFIQVEQSSPMSEALLQRELAKTLPHYMIPEKIVFVAGLPRTSTGKIDKKALATEVP